MITIVREQILDVPHIESLLDAAFGFDRKSKSSYSLRENIEPLQELGLVVRHHGNVVGTIRFWPAIIRDILNGKNQSTLLLGPFAIHPDLQGQGHGNALLQAALDQVDAYGFKRVMLVGCARYYGGFGFRTVKPRYISMPGNRDAGRLLVRQNGELSSLPTVGQLAPADMGVYNDIIGSPSYASGIPEFAF
jgi:predicted N-acetyltransferase YhbS